MRARQNAPNTLTMPSQKLGLVLRLHWAAGWAVCALALSACPGAKESAPAKSSNTATVKAATTETPAEPSLPTAQDSKLEVSTELALANGSDSITATLTLIDKLGKRVPSVPIQFESDSATLQIQGLDPASGKKQGSSAAGKLTISSNSAGMIQVAFTSMFDGTFKVSATHAASGVQFSSGIRFAKTEPSASQRRPSHSNAFQ